jgi:hypothetical protein
MVVDTGATTGSMSETQQGAPSDMLLVVNRWKRYGKDRLYVGRTDETKVGWWDLLTDEAHPETPADLPALTSAVQMWRSGTENASQQESAPHPAPVPQPVAMPLPSAIDVITADEGPTGEPAVGDRPWLDLATNGAGAAAREQAVNAKDAAPVRTLLARALGVHTEERAWRIGADGEEKVAAQLAKLVRKDPRWRVIHAIPVGTRGSDIDHLVIGPGGVFTINTKHHPGAKIWVGGSTFLVDGHKQPYVRNSRHEAARASDLLANGCGFPVHVEGVIVTVNADDVVVKTQPEGVSVVPRMQVTKWLLRHGPVMDSDTIEAVYEVARRSTTWRP